MDISNFCIEFCVQKLRSLEVDKFELFLERSSQLSLEVQEGKLDQLCRSTDQGLAIRVLKNQRMGFSYTLDLSRAALEKAIQTALEVGSLMPPDSVQDLASFSVSHYPNIEAFDTRGIETPVEKKIESALALEALTRKADPRIKRIRKAGLDENISESMLVDTNGDAIKHRQTLYAAYVTCVADDGKEAVMGYDSQYANFLDQISVEDVAREGAHSAIEILGAGKASTMTCPAVLKNSVVAQLLGFLASSFSAENVDKNFSLLVGKKGEKLFSEHLNIVDDGCLPGGVATAPFDGEGTPMRTTMLVESGMVMNYLYDNYYAKKHGVATTANSRRGSLKAPPGIGPSNLYLKKGRKTREKLISEISRGILITDVMGLHTANPITGDFSLGASGILIEGGKLTHPVKGFAIAGNLIELLKRVSAVGSDIRFWGSIGAPSMMISELSIGGA